MSLPVGVMVKILRGFGDVVSHVLVNCSFCSSCARLGYMVLGPKCTLKVLRIFVISW